jgi:8-oxo-dGTP pyrophosphatase MutT (NUDIX family)
MNKLKKTILIYGFFLVLILGVNGADSGTSSLDGESLGGIPITRDAYGNVWVNSDSLKSIEAIDPALEALKEHKGRVGLFLNYSTSFLERTPLPISSLKGRGFEPYRFDEDGCVWIFRNGRDIPEQSSAILDVRVALYNEEGKILLVQNRGTKFFYLPGGGVNRGELAKDGAIREIQEEVGLTLSKDDLTLLGIINLVIKISGKPTNAAGLWHACTKPVREADVKIDTDEIERIVWIDPKEINFMFKHEGIPINARMVAFANQFSPETSRKSSMVVGAMTVETFPWSR